MSRPSHFARVATLMLALALTACLPDRFAWSPDGSTVAYPDDASAALWIWDASTQQSRNLPVTLPATADRPSTAAQGRLQNCTYLPGGESLVALGSTQNGAMPLLKIDARSGAAEIIKQLLTDKDHAGWGPVVGKSGAIYCLSPVSSSSQMELQRSSADSRDWETLAQTAEASSMRISPAERLAVVAQKEDLCVIDLETRTTRSLPLLACPVWQDEERLLGMVPMAADAPQRALDENGKPFELGQLVTLNVADGTTAALAQHVHPWFAPAVRPDGGAALIVAAQLEGDTQPQPQNTPRIWQVAEVNLRDGTLRWLTRETFGAQFPSYAPSGDRVAYAGLFRLNIIDMASGSVAPQPRDAAERDFAAAETLRADGKWAEALALYEACGTSETTAGRDDLRDAARYRRFELLMGSALRNPRKACEALQGIDADLGAQALETLAPVK